MRPRPCTSPQFFPGWDGAAHSEKSMGQLAVRLDSMREELHQAGGHIKNAGLALTGKEPQESKELSADKGVLAKLRSFVLSCGKVFSEMEGNELFNMIAERSKIIKRRIDALMELHMSNISSDKPMSGKATKVIKKKKLVVPEDFKDFNIRDFV